MPVILANNVSSTIATAISASDVGLVVAPGTGTTFPVISSGNYFYATLSSAGGTYEIVKVTARSGDSMTIVRAQDGTIAQSFASGSRIEIRVTAKSIIDTATGGVVPAEGLTQTARGATFVSSATLSPPLNDVFISPGYNCQIIGYRLYTDGGTGSCVVDVRKSTYAAFPPTSLDSICGGNKPTISSGVSASDFTLTGWTKAIGQYDVIGISLDSSSTFSMVTLQLFLEQT